MIQRIECVNFDHSIRHIFYKGEKKHLACVLGPGSYLVDASFETGSMQASLLIGRYCSLGHRLVFEIGLNHDYHQVTTYPFLDLHKSKNDENTLNHYRKANHNQIIIGNDVWIGCDVTILGGVRIGNGAVIGAGAVVSKDIPAYSIVVGNPARVVKYRFSHETIQKLQQIKWWNWSSTQIEACWHEFEDAENFIKKYYITDDSREYVSEVSDYLAKLQGLGYKIYYLPLDVGQEDSVSIQVVKEYLRRFTSEHKTVLLLSVLSSQQPSDYLYIKELIDQGGETAANVIAYSVSAHEDGLNSVKKVIDCFITGKNDLYSRCIDCLSDINVNIKFGLDADCFD